MVYVHVLLRSRLNVNNLSALQQCRSLSDIDTGCTHQQSAVSTVQPCQPATLVLDSDLMCMCVCVCVWLEGGRAW